MVIRLKGKMDIQDAPLLIRLRLLDTSTILVHSGQASLSILPLGPYIYCCVSLCAIPRTCCMC